MPPIRQPTGFSRLTPVVRTVMIVLLVSWIGMAILIRLGPFGRGLYNVLALDPAQVVGPPWRVWTLVSYALLHSLDSPFHLLFNGLALYWFGPDIEDRLGRSRFCLMMLLTVLGGGVVVVVGYLLGLTSNPVIGASAFTAGLTVAWGLSYPDREFYFFFFQMRGIHLVLLMIGLEILNALSFSATSAAAHFGGMAVGAFYGQSSPLRRLWLKFRLARLQRQSEALRAPKRRAAASGLRVIPGGADKPRDPKDKRYLN